MNDPRSLVEIQDTELSATRIARPVESPRETQNPTLLSIPEQEVLQVADAVCRSVSLDSMRLPAEFHPGHLSVALIDAVFHPWRTTGDQSVTASSVVMRYCRRFGIQRVRAVPWEIPARTDQEALDELIRRYEVHGVPRMVDDALGVGASGCSEKSAAARRVLGAAKALQGIGVHVLQDVQIRRPEEIEDALRQVPGVGEETARLLLMFAGNDDFVHGDDSIRTFVASALGRRNVPGIYAAELVRRAAYEMILAPRLLDYLLWTYSARGDGLAKPPELAHPSASASASAVLGPPIPLMGHRAAPWSHD